MIIEIREVEELAPPQRYEDENVTGSVGIGAI
jgi:hypothetical protein